MPQSVDTIDVFISKKPLVSSLFVYEIGLSLKRWSGQYVKYK